MKSDQDLREMHRSTSERFIYVVEFTTGVVKVGRASHQSQRVAEHGRSAEKHGAAITRSWVSERHKEYARNETALIAFCAERWSLAGGKEYFAGANYGEVVKYAQTLPMTLITEADLDEFDRQMAEHKGDANRFISALWSINAVIASQRQGADAEPNQEDEDEYVLLEDVAPYEFVETVTAASTAKRHTAEALMNHDLRLKLDPFANTRDWKLALKTAQHGYEISLLLRALKEHAGAVVADEVARTMRSATYERCGEYRDELVAWAVEDGTDLDVLAEMTRASYEQIQKCNARYGGPKPASPDIHPAQPELPLGGEA